MPSDYFTGLSIQHFYYLCKNRSKVTAVAEKYIDWFSIQDYLFIPVKGQI
jgi:hypothetical protein